jgi:hypothetical protein
VGNKVCRDAVLMTLTDFLTAAIEIFRPLVPLWALCMVVIDFFVGIFTGLVVLAMG